MIIPGAPKREAHPAAARELLRRNGTRRYVILLFFFNDTATTEIYTLSLHDALLISLLAVLKRRRDFRAPRISLWDELMARLGIVQKWLTKRAVKAIDRAGGFDAEVHDTLARVRNVLD